MPSTFTIDSASDTVNSAHHSQSMFCNLNQPALAEYVSIGTEARHPKGTMLFRESWPGTSICIVYTGQVKLFCTSKEGKTLILKIAMPGDVLGLGAVISGSSYEVSAVTIQPTHIKRIRSEEFLAFLHRHSEVGLQAARALSEDYKGAFVDVRRLALSGSSAGRLAGLLLDWGKTAASSGKLEMRFTMTLSHEDLASLIGSARETVTRNLSQFKRDNLITMRGSSMLILAPKQLEQLSV